ncbi:MAG: hypothetical protein RBT73_03290 [Spirochaetia bacterium]|nr:hypothetical protein [Spirochaetia bacterium]
MDEQERLSQKRIFLADATAGLLSGFLYLSYILSFAFLIPVQQSFSGRGMRAGLVSSLAAFTVIAVGTVTRMIQLRLFDLISLVSGCLPPLLLLAALYWINATVPRLTRITRILLAALVLSIIALPFVLRMSSDSAFIGQLSAYVEETIDSSGVGFDESRLAAELVQRSLGIISAGFSAFILWILAGSWWLGSLLASKSRFTSDAGLASEKKVLRIAAVKVPHLALWPSLLLWSLLFIALALKAEGLIRLLAWNLALCAASIYGLQGIGVLSFLLHKPGVPVLLRRLLPLALIAALFNQATSAVVLIGLPVLGITEVWIPYRNLKGAST